MTVVDERLNERVRAALDTETNAPDAVLAARLRAVRLRALERAHRRPLRYQRLVPLGTVAAAIVLALSFMLSRPVPEEATPSVFELLAASPDMELIEELEFYEWLETRDHAG